MVLSTVILAAAGLAGVLKIGFGVGAGALLTPLLSLAIAPRQAVVIMAIVVWITDIDGVRRFWKCWSTTEIRVLLPAALLGTYGGSVLLFKLSGFHLARIVGVLALLNGLYFGGKLLHKDLPARSKKTSNVLGAVVGFVAGVFGATANSGGIILTSYLLHRVRNKREFVGTIMALLLILDSIKLIMYSSMGVESKFLLVESAVLAPAVLAGGVLGYMFHHKVPERQFFLFVCLVLSTSGLLLMFR